MTKRQRIVRVRRRYNQWVADQTLEDYALRFTALGARRWSTLRVANTALGAISFLACEAIGATITLNFGMENALLATLASAAVIFVTALPIAYYAARHGVDIDLLTRGSGFGYLGSTITSLVYASFTFIFFAIEAAIMATALNLWLGLPMPLGYLVSALVVIPVVTHGIRMISWLQLWTLPLWLVMQAVPLAYIALSQPQVMTRWLAFDATPGAPAGGANLLMFGAATSVLLSLIAQIGEQADFLRFLPPPEPGHRLHWWAAVVAAGPGWIVLGAAKVIAGSFLAILDLSYGLSAAGAVNPTELYRVAFLTLTGSPKAALTLVGIFVIVSQIKINVTNSYAGSIAWSNFFSRLTHSHPGRVVWLIFNVGLALLLMELSVLSALGHILGLYAVFAVAWIGALVGDLVVSKPLGLSPAYTEFRRAHLYDINPVGIGAMAVSLILSSLALLGWFGAVAQSMAPLIGLVAAFAAAPAIAALTRGRYYVARPPDLRWADRKEVECCICTHRFEPADMSFCPAYDGPICSLCCTLDARCHDLCKPEEEFFPTLGRRLMTLMRRWLPRWVPRDPHPRIARFVGAVLLMGLVLAVSLTLIDSQQGDAPEIARHAVSHSLLMAFFVLLIISGVLAWLLVLAQESRQVAEEESERQTTMLFEEIEAHKITDAELHKAKEEAEAANLAKSNYLLGISHEIRTPLNAIFGYAQLLDGATQLGETTREGGAAQRDAARVIKRSAQHLAHLVDGLLDLSKIEAGRLQLAREEVRLHELLDQIADIFRMHAEEKGLEFRVDRSPNAPELVRADGNRLWQILSNLVSNALKYTENGGVTLSLRYRSQVAEFVVKDTGMGIDPQDLDRIFEPFERGRLAPLGASPGTGLGLTITKLLTEIMGGEIALSSTVGEGSTFRVRLFLPALVPASHALPARLRPVGYRGRRRTVLVVDDDSEYLVLIRRILSPLGFEMVSASNGSLGLEAAARCRPDLVLLDLSMPGMSGWEVMRRLRADHGMAEEGSGLVIVVVSANAEDLDSGDDRALYDAFLPKPLDIDQLIERIGSLLDLSWLEAPAPLHGGRLTGDALGTGNRPGAGRYGPPAHHPVAQGVGLSGADPEGAASVPGDRRRAPVPDLPPLPPPAHPARPHTARGAGLVRPLHLNPGRARAGAMTGSVAGLRLPAARHLDDLKRLGEIGYIEGIEAKLTEIEAAEPDSAAFVGVLRALIRDMELRRYASVLEGALRGHG
ncbi:hybrid sensor histidine kinase/response regulator [Acidimangrovimonas sediminis]|uniref:hybrid sensor histidine kinase/response regulator n=1 Tax=Acidimangrovimonas sediminis TaxID=2056283 RepID=UPI0011AF5127|nr:ATP-binding protein [Acidimangrovimonas sediminis]